MYLLYCRSGAERKTKRGLVFSNIRGFLVITFLFLIFRSWKFAWLDLLGAYFEKWSRFVRTTTLTWVSTTWSPSLKRWWTSSWCSNSTSGHATDLILVSNPWFLGARNHFGPFPEALDWIEGQEWVCPESEFLHEELHHLLREGDHVVDTHGNVVVCTKRDHFSKYAPKRSNHANFQLIKIKNKKVMTKKPLIVEKSNPLWVICIF